MAKTSFATITNTVKFINILIAKTKQKRHSYLENETRSPLKEKHDFELEFILDVFATKRFDAEQYLCNEYKRVGGIQHTQRIINKLDKCIAKTSISLKELVQDNYVDFISCFNQIHGIEQFFSKDHHNIFFERLLYAVGTILSYQDELCFNFKWDEYINDNNIADKDIFYDENNIVVIPGNDIVDSPSALIDEIMTMCDETKWHEAISILNMITQDMYRGEYNYLKPKTRKQIKKQVKKFRKIIYKELANLLRINARNKSYRRRLTIYILRIQKCRYFNRGIKLYFNCKLKELNNNINQIQFISDSKIYISDLTTLIFDTIGQLITEFNEILIESGNRHHKNALSYLTVFILKDVLFRYIEQFKINLFEARKCDISLKLIGECLRISFGCFNKLKWTGLYLEMHLNDYLFEIVCNSLNLYFDDEINQTHHSLLNDSFKIKEISLLALNTNSNNNNNSLSIRKYQTVVTDIPTHENNNNNNNKKDKKDKITIYVTASAQIVYKNIRKCLCDSQSLLSFSYYPIMTKKLLSIFIENIIKYLQSYCSNITQALREYEQHNLTESQCIAIISNVYYITNDLLQRINNRLLKQSRILKNKKVPRIESFKNKLTILYEEQIKYFSKTTSINLIKNILKFDSTDKQLIPEYYNEKAHKYDQINIVSPSKSWIETLEKILSIIELCNKYLHHNVANTMTINITNAFIKRLNNERYWLTDDKYERNITYYGLQQFIFDIKFFEFAANYYLEAESKLITHNTIINNAIKLYSSINANNAQQITSGVVIKSNESYLINIKDFLSLYPYLDIKQTRAPQQVS